MANQKKPITPLWIVALFVSLTETVLGIAVTQTAGGVQIALTVFVLAFPLLIAGCFFAVLWHKPYVFYPPTEFGHQINVIEYVQAMQLRPALEKQVHQPRNEKEIKAANTIAESFLKQMPFNGTLTLYACTLSYTKKRPFNLEQLCSELGYLTPQYAWGFIMATSSAGLMRVSNARGIWNIKELDMRIVNDVRAEIGEHIKSFGDEKTVKLPKSDVTVSREQYVEAIQNQVKLVEKYFD